VELLPAVHFWAWVTSGLESALISEGLGLSLVHHRFQLGSIFLQIFKHCHSVAKIEISHARKYLIGSGLDLDLPLGLEIVCNYAFENGPYSKELTVWCFLGFIFLFSRTAFSSLEWGEA